MPALESHPWSSGFTWTDHAGPSSTLTPEQVAAFDRDGYVVLPDLVPPDLLALSLIHISEPTRPY